MELFLVKFICSEKQFCSHSYFFFFGETGIFSLLKKQNTPDYQLERTPHNPITS